MARRRSYKVLVRGRRGGRRSGHPGGNASVEGSHYLGRLEDVNCFALDIQADPAGELRPPDGRSLEGLRGLFGRLPDALYSVAGGDAERFAWQQPSGASS